MWLTKKYLIAVKYFLLLSIFINIYFSYNNRIFPMTVLLVFSTILMMNDYLRSNKLVTSINYVYYSSLLFTIFGAVILAHFVSGAGTSIYIFFTLVELLKLKRSALKILFLVHLTSFMIMLILDIGIPTNWEKLISIGFNLLDYFAIASIAYSSIIVRREKEEVSKLNEKLKQANIKLQQNVFEIEELTASKERTMMAQELHDSLGHSLMALAMHLEFAENICDMNPDKVKEVIIKSQEIAKSSITSLREAVDLLKEDREIKDFNESIKTIIDNFHILNNIKINYSADKNFNNLSSVIKSSMYKTIKEFITNSIKHGRASEINIKIIREKNSIRLILTDDGIGCNKIIKSNGLLGIDNRIMSLNGVVKYLSNSRSGFMADISIPIIVEEM